MEYVQERIATLHDFDGRGPPVGTQRIDSAAVVVPITHREFASLAAERVFSTLESLAPARVIVPVRAPADRIEAIDAWLSTFDLERTTLWCNAPGVETLLDDLGLENGFGKGRDVWLALGPAATAGETVVVHDADAENYDTDLVSRLLAPLSMGYSFSKGYYARVENDRLYGRLFRLFYAPLLRALTDRHRADVLAYLDAFRYALAGEFAMTASLARQLRAPRSWGLEVGTLGDAFDHAGFAGSAQVDLGRHEHDHRAVAGDTGLEGMSRAVAATLFHVLEDHGIHPEYDLLRGAYAERADELVSQYRADATFNGLDYDPERERGQVRRYADAIAEPGPDRRLPSWSTVALEPAEVVDAGRPEAP
ncbi:glycosyl transferase family 2 [Halovivax limisalsi]|uniref:glycosyl transferase family 2 n=1 Tax=Halovivax limisalsi TaxID=1453760 RepID=UPI001FFC927D|nr:glycosyl transferase family 2 [Halovivax limisalsi]